MKVPENILHEVNVRNAEERIKIVALNSLNLSEAINISARLMLDKGKPLIERTAEGTRVKKLALKVYNLTEGLAKNIEVLVIDERMKRLRNLGGKQND
jgi:hypothetical protein